VTCQRERDVSVILANAAASREGRRRRGLDIGRTRDVGHLVEDERTERLGARERIWKTRAQRGGRFAQRCVGSRKRRRRAQTDIVELRSGGEMLAASPGHDGAMGELDRSIDASREERRDGVSECVVSVVGDGMRRDVQTGR